MNEYAKYSMWSTECNLLIDNKVLTSLFIYKLTLMYVVCHFCTHKLPNTLHVSKRLVAPWGRPRFKAETYKSEYNKYKVVLWVGKTNVYVCKNQVDFLFPVPHDFIQSCNMWYNPTKSGKVLLEMRCVHHTKMSNVQVHLPKKGNISH
jgi:hypothetical protein